MPADTLFRMSYVILWALVVLQAIALFLVFRQFGVMYLTTHEGVEGDGLSPGEGAPDFTLPTPSGQLMSLASVLEQGKGALILFGSPHCRFCHQVLPEFHRITAEFSEEIVALYISQGTKTENRYVADEFDGPATLLLTEDEEVARKYKSRVTPFAFAIDRHGIVRAKGLANSYAQLRHMAESTLTSSAGIGGAATVKA